MGCNSSVPLNLDPWVFREFCDHDIRNEEIVFLGNGSKRNIISWIPRLGQIKAIVFICHSLHDHSLMYDSLCHSITKKVSNIHVIVTVRNAFLLINVY
jgi:hypothetical protein